MKRCPKCGSTRIYICYDLYSRPYECDDCGIMILRGTEHDDMDVYQNTSETQEEEK